MSGDWKVEYGLWDPPPETWAKVEPEHAHALVVAQDIRCDECHDRIAPVGPVRIWTNQDGVIRRRICGTCVRMYVARQRVEMVREEILKRVHKGRSKGLLSKELMAEGRNLSDIREAFAELLDEGALVQHKSMVRKATGQLALL